VSDVLMLAAAVTLPFGFKRADRAFQKSEFARVSYQLLLATVLTLFFGAF
jgi:hypothetical protein